MPEAQEVLTAAIELVREALDRLDSIDARTPAIHLQHAIALMTTEPVPLTEGDAERALQGEECQALMRRLGWISGDPGAVLALET